MPSDLVSISRRCVLQGIGAALATCPLIGRATAAPSALVPVPRPDKLAHLTAFFDHEVAAGKLPGAVVLIQQHGKPVYQRCFGWRTAARRHPMTPDTIFALHSMTKPITSVAAMMLVDEGRLALHDPLAKYIPAFARVKVGIETTRHGKPALKLVATHRPVTIEDLLRHTSGITYEYIGGELIMAAYEQAHLFAGRFDNAIFADGIARLPLARQPGTLWRYGHSTDVLGRVIEIVSGEPLYEFLKRRLFDPLGMTSTGFVLRTEAERARMAAVFPADTVLVESERQRRAHPEWQSGGGGLLSTATDYARFAQMLLEGGALDGRRYLSPAAYGAMTTDQIGPASGVERDYFYFPGDGFGYGYGLAVRVEPGEASPPAPGSIGELKWDSGSGTYFGVDPSLDMIYILMQQTETERGRVVPAFKTLVYDAFAASDRTSERPPE
ncbi:class A beta-lactamase-related serine hydrolase [Rhodopseudomonas sp. WA056]|uniref:serine hydrolase domain-containing protein n=1 Tax=Rhodopseudomonas sp. WA056 TaxID=2269367 RepID=UPI0013DED787|nr:serine hydrolase domain-containing protein [Rhodopseudomonas sp. WA056]NEW87697.1 class A beta-lactamase-related serine hydrolase [Rhodopseudomonas sp. WA056]